MFKDSHTGKDSTSKTLFVVSSLVVFVKVLISGVAFGDFSGASVDFLGLAAVHAVFASAYYGRSKVKANVRED